jgi:hypothetical protein
MTVAPSPHGLPRIEELGDSTSVSFRPRRSWGDVGFLIVWLTLWTFGGIAAMHALVHAPLGGRLFLAFWLCGWLVGETAVGAIVAWKLFGREALVVTSNELEVRRQVGHFSSSQRVPTALVDSVNAKLVPVGEDERPRSDYCVEISTGGKKIRVGHSMDRSGAEYVASLVLAWVGPRSWWQAADDEDAEIAPLDAVERPAGRTGRLLRALLFPAFVVGLLVLLALPRHHHHSPAIPHALPPSAVPNDGPPSAASFSDPGDYAAAMTRYALKGGGTDFDGKPACDASSTWHSWSCQVPATATLGPFAGRRLTYRCSSNYEPQPDGRPLLGTLCGPVYGRNR